MSIRFQERLRSRCRSFAPLGEHVQLVLPVIDGRHPMLASLRPCGLLAIALALVIAWSALAALGAAAPANVASWFVLAAAGLAGLLACGRYGFGRRAHLIIATDSHALVVRCSAWRAHRPEVVLRKTDRVHVADPAYFATAVQVADQSFWVRQRDFDALQCLERWSDEAASAFRDRTQSHIWSGRA